MDKNTKINFVGSGGGFFYTRKAGPYLVLVFWTEQLEEVKFII